MIIVSVLFVGGGEGEGPHKWQQPKISCGREKVPGIAFQLISYPDPLIKFGLPKE